MDGDALVVGTVSAEPALALPGVAPIPLNRLVAAFAGRGEP
jgi:hypothetical protein